MENAETALLPDIKTEIDVAEEILQPWRTTEPNPYVSLSGVVATENTAAKHALQTLEDEASDNMHSDALLDQAIQPSEAETAVTVHSDMSRKRHVCTECDITFATPCYLKKHMLTHAGDRPFACTECDQRFSRSINLSSHKTTHKPKKHACTVCGDRFKRPRCLKRHMLLHTGENKHACPECGVGFTAKKSLTQHMFRCNGKKQPEQPESNARLKHSDNLEPHVLTYTEEKETFMRIVWS